MTDQTLGLALEQEHRSIDQGIAATLSSIADGHPDFGPLRGALSLLRRHIYLEEARLFPPLRGGRLAAAIFVMLREHGEMWGDMTALDARIEAGDAAAVASQARSLLAALDQHNGKEEPVIYSGMDPDLPPGLATELVAWLAEGRMPAGWVCARATAAAT